MRELCGAVSGMAIVMGLLRGYSDLQDKSLKAAHYDRLQGLCSRFLEENGSLRCGDLLGETQGPRGPVPGDRTPQYYEERPCPRLVAQAAALVRAAEEQLGPLDALVCNAGVALPQQLLTDTTDEQWRQVMGVDLDGVFYTLRAAVPGFVLRQRGAIVTVSSMWGVTGGSCEVAYSAAKAGVIGLTKALAKELGPSHITVNCVAPGVIDTEMNGGLDSEALAALAEETPLGRIGTAEEVAESVWFLAGGGAPFLTGQVIQPNGGIVI